ncbi:MAG: tRNA-guanine transglycosylase, partial [Chthoniobacterales bacterium]|nr:tRNA-guanine transglycosylase [Chthoniobacterales bacterium]
MFQLLQTDDKTRARRGRLTTAHGVIETPAFMPVGTQGSVKAVSPRELRQLEAQVILGNTYHLFVRPGMEVIRQFGGLHRFMSWNAPILTDSGGYQIFSLAKLRRIIEEGVHFQNHLDGSPAFISPEIAMEIQATLGSDIAMVLDECPPWPCEREYAARSLEMTIRWARRCKAAAQRGTEENVERRTSNVEGQSSEAALIDDEASTSNQLLLGSERGTEASVRRSTSNFQRPTSKSINHQPSTLNQLLFGIVQGGTFADLRRESAEALVEIGFDGYAIGGVSVGEPEPEMMNAVENSELYLPP